ncbi:MAG: T9SS type A sorting domain-containing protein [Saprospiraceae bacterium]|nr:T9SS type A sorting domain-containing protein [Saprospiraceae bacterium]
MRQKILLMALLTLFASREVIGETFNIPNGDVNALIAAINSANANSEADVINLATNGIYNLSAVNNTISNPNIGGGNGLPAIINSFTGAGADITINGNGATIQRSSTGDLRILVISGSGTEVIINNVIFKNARATLNGACIAAMWKDVRLTINDCAFENNVLTPVGANTEDGGGAILIHEGFLSVNNTTFKGNTAPNGGAIKCLLSNMTLTNCTFENNRTTGTGNNGGAGVIIDGAKFDGATRQINITLCKFINNADIKQGGGLFYYTYGNSTSIVDRCYFKGNTSPSGAGMHAGVDNSSNNNLTISNTTFDANIASGASGGLNIFSPNASNFTININNSTFAFNQANGGTAGGGGAVANFGGTLSFSNCTIAKNSTNAFGGGISGHSGSISIKNSIIADNTATNNFGAFGVSNIQRNCASGGFVVSPPPYFNNGGNNLEWPARTDLTNNGLCTPSITVADPRLDNAVKDNGGEVPTLAILAGSAAIDAGAGCTTTDQRGVARVGTCDIGAFEFGGTVTSIIEIDGINRLRVYPNPTNTQKLFIEIPSEIRARELEIVIINNLGVSVQKMKILSNEEKVMIDLKNLPSGTYVLITKNDKMTYTSKIIVE